MAEVRVRKYKAFLMCPGPDGEDECGEAVEGEMVDEGTKRSWYFDTYECPKCHRQDGFSVESREEIV